MATNSSKNLRNRRQGPFIANSEILQNYSHKLKEYASRLGIAIPQQSIRLDLMVSQPGSQSVGSTDTLSVGSELALVFETGR